MKRIIIKSKTSVGESALRLNQKEALKLSRFHKAQMKLLGITQIYKENPLRFIIEFNKPQLQGLVQDKHIKQEAIETMTKNGAEENKDYIIEVE